MLLHIIIPTHFRHQKLMNCLGSIEQARTLLDCYSYVFVYYSDKEEFEKDSIGLINYKNILPKLLEKPYFASEFWNDHIKSYNADIYIYLNDDIVLEMNALKRVVNIMNEKFNDLDGVVAITQENIPENQACPTAFGAIGTKFTDRFPDRKVFCEDYERLYLDSELGEYAKSQGKLFHSLDKSMAPLLTHFHPGFFPNMKDSTHDDVRTHLRKDKITNNRRKSKNLLWGRDFTLINAKN
jgi:hypothetical protein